jgi:hypothetical protein
LGIVAALDGINGHPPALDGSPCEQSDCFC